jgi:hypothetical protein
MDFESEYPVPEQMNRAESPARPLTCSIESLWTARRHPQQVAVASAGMPVLIAFE